MSYPHTGVRIVMLSLKVSVDVAVSDMVYYNEENMCSAQGLDYDNSGIKLNLTCIYYT